MVRPHFERKDLAPGFGWGKAAPPTVIFMMLEGFAPPVRLPVLLFPAPDQRGCAHGMSVAKNIGPYVDRLSNDAFDRKAAAVHRGKHVLDKKSGFRPVIAYL